MAALAASLLAAAPLRAATSNTLDSEGGTIRLVAAAPEADGTVPAVLDIRLAPGWKTYWRDPGASGLAPSVTLPPESGFALDGIGFPPPRLFDDGTVRYVGYDRPVALPLRLKRLAPQARRLDLSVLLGICKEICIPVQGDLALTLDEGPHDRPLDRARIKDAAKWLPEPPSEDFRLQAAQASDDGRRIDIRVALPEGGGEAPEVFVAAPDGYAVHMPVARAVTGRTMTARIDVLRRPKGKPLDLAAIHIVVRAGARSMETPLAFE
ncbi:protein-disulfide reductase DsbD domain-containing protein [Ensifer soli]|uniref:protein-disulfide reductase DsbD domain-containing protein n=1 Tax=Ciceribacter sp. sgz301302 TaxID=3342379 RepID=UPI0035B8BB87